MEAAQHYRAGDLGKAIEAATAAVRSRPADVAARGFLCEMLCIGGNLDRADAQLEIVTNQSPKAVAGVSLLRQLIRAAKSRQEFFEQGRVPDVLSDPEAPVRAALEAQALLRSGDGGRAAEVLRLAEEARRPLGGAMDGTPFDDIRDCDDLFASVFEVLTSTGKYYWVPMANVVRMKPRKPERPIDLLWLPVEMTVRDGPDGVVYLPTIYGGTRPTDPAPLLLGRQTEWDDSVPGVVRGRGLRLYLVGDRDLAPMQLGEITLGA